MLNWQTHMDGTDALNWRTMERQRDFHQSEAKELSLAMKAIRDKCVLRMRRAAAKENGDG